MKTSTKPTRSTAKSSTPRANSNRDTTPAVAKPETTNQKPETSFPPIQPDISNQKSEIRNPPFSPLPEFADLAPDQLEFIHDIVRNKTYAEAQEEIWHELQVRISTNRLFRYKQRLDLATLLQAASENASAIDNLNDLLAGRQTALDPTGLHAVKQRALALAASPSTSPSLLKDLHRIFTYEDRKQQIDRTQELRAAQLADLSAHRQATQAHRDRVLDFHKTVETNHHQIALMRETTRKQSADLADRKFEAAEKRAAQNQKQTLNSEESIKLVELIRSLPPIDPNQAPVEVDVRRPLRMATEETTNQTTEPQPLTAPMLNSQCSMSSPVTHRPLTSNH